MTTNASPTAEVTETADPTAGEGTEGQVSGEFAQEGGVTSEPAPTPAPTETSEPVDVIEASQNLKDAIGEQSETARGILDTLDTWAIEIGNLRFSLLDTLLIIVVIMVIVTIAWMVTRLARMGIRRASRLDGSQKILAEKLSTILIWTVAFLVGIDLLGIDLTALAFFGGAFGLAIGFGLQKTFGNLISGIILLMDKSIKPGDVISVTDAAGNEAAGQIRKIGIRAISVITRDQTEFLIPNENLMTNQVVNWSYSSRDVRVKAPVGVSYNSDLELVTGLLYQAVSDTPRVLARPKPRVNLMEFGDSSVNFEIRFWIRDPEEGLSNIRSDILMRVWHLFKENDIEIPFPQRDLHLRSSKQLDMLIDTAKPSR